MFRSTKKLELGSCAFRQPRASHSHCRFIHGYKLSAKFWFEAKELDEHNWVFDFGGLKGFKKILKDQFDHTTCIAAEDPALPIFQTLVAEDACDLRIMPNGTGIERIAEWCHQAADAYVDEYTDGRCKCVKVEVFEHEDNSAIYENRSSAESGPTYMEDKADEIEKSVNQMKRSKVIETKPNTPTKKETPGEKTLPTFAKNIPASVGNKRVTNKWIDPNSKNTWGI